MSDDEDWKDPYEESGVTLGPEEALRREIEKSKSLKVERLKFKDEIEKLRAENAHLTQSIEELKERSVEQPPTPPQQAPSPSSKWFLIFLIFNLCTLGILFYVLMQK